jgi:hypothetical protein
VNRTLKRKAWRRVATLFLAVALLLLASPGAARAAITNTDPWIYQIEGGWNHFVRVCDVGYPSNGDVEQRIIDAFVEWEEINGELNFGWNDISDSACNDYMANDPRPWIKVTNGLLSGDTLGQTNNNWVNGSGRIYNCLITIDSNTLADWQHYYTESSGGYGAWYFGSGSPPAGQIDFESVLVHEIGHCLAVDGHLDAPSSAVMYGCLNPTCGNPEGIEKDERTASDTPLYSNMYGTTH